MREKISGMSVEEYREWMLENIDDVLLRNKSDSVDEIVARMQDDEVEFYSVNPTEFEGVM